MFVINKLPFSRYTNQMLLLLLVKGFNNETKGTIQPILYTSRPIKLHICCALAIITNGTKYSRMDQVKFVEDSLLKFEGIWSASSRPCPFKFFKVCLPQILLGLFLNTLSQMFSQGTWGYLICCSV